MACGTGSWRRTMGSPKIEPLPLFYKQKKVFIRESLDPTPWIPATADNPWLQRCSSQPIAGSTVGFRHTQQH